MSKWQMEWMYSQVRLNVCLVPSIFYRVSSSASKTVNGKYNLHETLVALGGHESATSITTCSHILSHMDTCTLEENKSHRQQLLHHCQSITMLINVIINQCKPAAQGPNYIFHSDASMAKSFPIIALSKHSSYLLSRKRYSYSFKFNVMQHLPLRLLFLHLLNLFSSYNNYFQCLRKTFLAHVTSTSRLARLSICHSAAPGIEH